MTLKAPTTIQFIFQVRSELIWIVIEGVTTISNNVIAYLSNTKIIIVNMYMFLEITAHMKIENVNSVNHIVNNTLFLTLGTPNSSSL